MSQLNDITLMNENVQNEDLLVEDLEDNTVNQVHESEQQKFSGKRKALVMKTFDAHKSWLLLQVPMTYAHRGSLSAFTCLNWLALQFSIVCSDCSGSHLIFTSMLFQV